MSEQVAFEDLHSALMRLAEVAGSLGEDDDADHTPVYMAMRDVHVLVGTLSPEGSGGARPGMTAMQEVL